MKLIALTQGQFTKVDDEDYDFLMQWKWHAQKHYKTGKYYAVRRLPREKYKPRKSIQMHRLLLGLTKTFDYGDHSDRDTLNNQRNNLRKASMSQNGANRTCKKNSHSKYLGVFFYSGDKRLKVPIKKYQSSCRSEGILHFLGLFPYTPEGEIQAAKAYDKAAKKHHGEFANLNFK